ncbi:MAG: GAF domain-containing protein [Phycisphaerales bacterium]
MTIIEELAGVADLEGALDRVVSALRAESGTVHLLGPDGQLHLRAATASIPPPVREIVKVVPVGKGMAGLAVQRNAPVNACNIQTDTSGDVRPGAKATGMEGAIVVPMRRDGRVVGALGVANRAERTFSAEEIATLESAGELLARRFGQ